MSHCETGSRMSFVMVLRPKLACDKILKFWVTKMCHRQPTDQPAEMMLLMFYLCVSTLTHVHRRLCFIMYHAVYTQQTSCRTQVYWIHVAQCSLL